MAAFPFLSVLTFLPLVGALGVLAWGRNDLMARRLALTVSLVTLIVSIAALTGFHAAQTDFQFVERLAWIPSLGIAHVKGIDGLSLCFVLITTMLMPLAIAAGFSVTKRVKVFMALLLVMETMLIGAFTSLDLILFYIFFEGALIPMFLVIGLWGGEKRVYAATKFFLYTFLGSVFMLVAFMTMAVVAGTTDMTALIGNRFPPQMALWLWLAVFASFAVKMPFWPFHTWLPYAHVEAPTAGSVILAGLLLKLGGYGLIRLSLQILPEASAVFAPMVMTLAVIGIVYASVVALAQTDMKKLIAYLSVAHMGYAALGLFSRNVQGVEGALYTMISHAFVSGALFVSVGVVYDRVHTREIARFGGMAHNMPRYAALFMLFMLAAIGLPGTSGFVGEFLAMQGAYQTDAGTAAFAVLGLVLGAAPMLVLYRRLFFGALDKPEVKAMSDLTPREKAIMLPLAALILVLGLYPAPLHRLFAPAAAKLVADIQHPVRSAP